MADRFQEIYDIITKIDKGVIVEIGSNQCNLTRYMLENSNCTVYCVDPYTRYDDYLDSINNLTGDRLFSYVSRELIAKYGDRVQFIREFSDNAMSLVPDNIDFLYIDGNHSYKYVYSDLKNYYPKVKTGGIIMGDDAIDTDESKRNEANDVYVEWYPGCFGNYGVIKAFGDFLSHNNIHGEIIGNQYVVHKVSK